ncbi:hypothetical protein SDC9_98330 [bioreactor metagenome]|jgi:hypothetical protein|uniref:DUF1468 domain-containing protein n=1 Tax=bioreactor metagenome TaxID=1076179 RepID=A0A645AH16_9ZZZZ|nr:tripartite tricarboxylate transporter TctB family protein [Sphaerochaeta sp.]
MDTKQKDFTISLVLSLVGIYATVEGIRMYLKAAQPPFGITNLSISPALLPIILGSLLLILSLVLFFQSVKGSSIRERLALLSGWFGHAVKDTDIRMMVGGMAIMAIYAFLLIGLLPYYLASLIFLIALMLFLRASTIVKSIIISIAAVGLVILLFQYGFNVSLP